MAAWSSACARARGVQPSASRRTFGSNSMPRAAPARRSFRASGVSRAARRSMSAPRSGEGSAARPRSSPPSRLGELEREERVSRGALAQELGAVRAHLVTELTGDQSPQFVRVQAAQGQNLRGRLGGERLQVARADLDRRGAAADGARDPDPCGTQRGSDRAEQRERVGVGELQVVEPQQERSRLRAAGQRARELAEAHVAEWLRELAAVRGARSR